MAEILRKKVSVRRCYREVLSKRLSEAKIVLETIETSEAVDAVKLGQLRLSINEKLTAIKKLDDEIVELRQDVEEIVKDITETDEFNEKVYEHLARIELYLSGSAKGISESVATSSHASSQAKLPKLDLPVFKGDVTEWMTFWDLYSVAVHTNPGLSPIERFTYLRTLVSHSAKDAIAGLSLTAANYEVAIELLQSRFGNKELSTWKHCSTLIM